MAEKLESAKDLLESLAVRKICGTSIELNSEETKLAYEVFSVDVKLPFEISLGAKS